MSISGGGLTAVFQCGLSDLRRADPGSGGGLELETDVRSRPEAEFRIYRSGAEHRPPEPATIA